MEVNNKKALYIETVALKATVFYYQSKRFIFAFSLDGMFFAKKHKTGITFLL